jgi:hypothetical protein
VHLVIVSGIKVISFCLLGMAVPGTPVALYLYGKSRNLALAIALTPIFSIGINFFLLQVLNYAGLKVDLKIIAAIEVIATLLGIFIILKRNKPSTDILKSGFFAVAVVAPATILGIAIWQRAYSGFVFLAANQDAFNHNKWIYRIASTGSALTKDAFIASPFQELGVGGGFYPLAWHSWVAVWSSSTGLTVPVASLMSVILIWTVILPLGLVALAQMWAPKVQYLGLVAAVLSQVYPLVPGVPMTWGSMTSVVGIAFLPASLAAGVCMLRGTQKTLLFVLLIVPASLFFIHTPEAISLLVLLTAVAISELRNFSRQVLRAVLLGLASFVFPLLFIFRDTIFTDSSSKRNLWGAAHPSWEIAQGSFFMMNINAQIGFTILSILFVVGLLASASMENQKWLVIGVFFLFLVYLTSGADNGILSHFRVLTTPWYASYERTLWVVVPFAALVSAYPLAKMLPSNLMFGRAIKTISLIGFCALAILIMQETVGPTISKIRSGPAVSAFIGHGDLDVIEDLDGVLGREKIAISFNADGSTYGYMYKGLKLTSGYPLNSDGNPSDSLSTIYQNLGDLCSSEISKDAFSIENVGAVVFAKRGVWGQTIWTDSEIRRLPGLTTISTGEFLVLTVPDFAKC